MTPKPDPSNTRPTPLELSRDSRVSERLLIEGCVYVGTRFRKELARRRGNERENESMKLMAGKISIVLVFMLLEYKWHLFFSSLDTAVNEIYKQVMCLYLLLKLLYIIGVNKKKAIISLLILSWHNYNPHFYIWTLAE